MIKEIKYNRSIYQFNENLDNLKTAYMTLSTSYIFEVFTLFVFMSSGWSSNGEIKFKSALHINITDDIREYVCCGLDDNTIISIIDNRFNDEGLPIYVNNILYAEIY